MQMRLLQYLKPRMHTITLGNLPGALSSAGTQLEVRLPHNIFAHIKQAAEPISHRGQKLIFQIF